MGKPRVGSGSGFGGPGGGSGGPGGGVMILRWRHMIRNFTIRNRDSRRLVFLNFLLWVKELVNSDCRFGFLLKNCIYRQLDMSRIRNFGQKHKKFPGSRSESAISYRMSPP